MLVTAAGLGVPGVLRGQERPLRTEDPAPIPAGAILLETGVDLDKLAAAGRFICGHLGRAPTSKVAQALIGRLAA